MPILGVKHQIHERNKETLSRKGFIQMKDTDFYSSRRLNEPYVSNLMNESLQKYVLDPALRSNHSTSVKITSQY